MTTAITIIAYIFATFSFLPEIGTTHWFFRIFDFIRIQVVLLQSIVFVTGLFLFEEGNTLMLAALIILFIAIIYQAIVIAPYIPFKKNKDKGQKSTINILSVNVLQKNDNYEELIKLVKEVDPDILLTMETNKAWEQALEKIEVDYISVHKAPKENRYGMHFYSKLKAHKIQTHYFISDERPAIEAHLVDKNGNDFAFIGIHPPPPSPTEKTTSKQKDGELMKAAKHICELNMPTIVTGDFNNVCWSKSSKLFSKAASLVDARLGKGIYGTFPVSPAIFRFPLDLLYHSKGIEVNQLKILRDISSDHFPFYTELTIVNEHAEPNSNLDKDLKEKADEIIEEGEQAEEIDE
ncbi:endonuclease/exonuclease/phosphatase family protein [Crocinitomix catalasitica]|uniref:endonuclease/exonuclease/phosphatase family protein n=1 Tax=Crocinitomix catalasitica TaxID=184607 RepID=UPI0006875C63|nr:endonuclease/exonuclease/phosphatase family protein [Crocinitomix catalasitica]